MSTTETRAVTGEIAWHDLLTTDVEAAQSFYGELLGWRFTPFKPGELDYPMIRVNDEHHGGIGPVAADERPRWLAHVRVDDVDEAVRRAEAAGGSLRGEPGGHEEVGRWATIADPAGAAISAFEPAYDTPASQAVFVWEELASADPEAARAFYTEALGWGSGAMDLGEAGTYVLLKRADGRDVAGIATAGPGAPEAWYPYVGVDDTDAAAARATALGASILLEPVTVPAVGRLAVLADPQGALFGLFRPA